MPLKGLLSYFEPFDGFTSNSSERVVSSVLSHQFDNVELKGVELPVKFGEAWTHLKEAIDQVQPDFILPFGQAGRITEVHLERVAINLMDARIPDNAGYQPEEEKISESGPAAFFSTLPLKALIKHLHERDHKSVIISNTAGTYVCNSVMYQLLEYAHRHHLAAGFIHVPTLPDQLRQGKPPKIHGSLELSSAAIIELVGHLETWIKTTQKTP